MGDIIQTFHIDWHLMLAQLINFAIVAFVLWRFGLKPLMKVMATRAKEIEDGLAQAKRIEQEMKQIESKKIEADIELKRKAEVVLNEAAQDAARRRQEIMDQVRAEAAEAVAAAKKQLEAEREAALGDVRREAARLITLATTRVITKLKLQDVDKEAVKEVVGDLGKRKK